MKVRIAAAPLALGLLLGGTTTAMAQDGFALKGHYIYNQAADIDPEGIPSASGFGLGFEWVFRNGLGLGLAGYTGGKLRDFHRETSNTMVLGELNYFVHLPVLPVSPYAGVHAGMGTYRWEDFGNPALPRPKDSFRQLGYQVGARLRVTRALGLDAHYRRVSTSLNEEQPPEFTRNQFLVGVTLF